VLPLFSILVCAIPRPSCAARERLNGCSRMTFALALIPFSRLTGGCEQSDALGVKLGFAYGHDLPP
jgi:hypothetical protein